MAEEADEEVGTAVEFVAEEAGGTEVEVWTGVGVGIGLWVGV